ncbi:LacI family DNA-binding transcriptional regulator [Bacillus sp. 1P06AnD]|uniref:LacI family DNA-binding transcriptional regulator n=1 Tax=Bacillus sp. 1P06AnD TaxID=3132208 RepID=UPI0039A09828
MATLADVAKLTGLSRATISRVINNHPYVSEEKKKAVQEAIRKLNYVPNASAQKLRNQKTYTIAVLVPKLTNPFFAYLLEGIDKIATENGYFILTCHTQYDKQKEMTYMNYLKSKQVDGIILTSFENEWSKLSPYHAYGPLVLCNEYQFQEQVPLVRLNQFEGAYIGTRHLIENGHRKIGYCSGDQPTPLTRDRYNGYAYALQEAGIMMDIAYTFQGILDLNDGKKVFHLGRAMAEPPTAYFTGSDQVAAGIILEAKQHGIGVPEHLSVVGFDDQQIASVVEPALTTIRQPSELIGMTAMKTMLKALDQKLEKEDMDIQLPLEFIIRKST